MSTLNYRRNTSQRAERLATFRKQMADFARAERLRDLREARHLSQEDAAHEIGVSVKSLRAWEKGGGIRWANAKSVAAFYRVKPETLVSREAGGAAFSEESAEDIPEWAQQVLDQQAELLAVLFEVRDDQARLLRTQAPGEQTGEATSP